MSFLVRLKLFKVTLNVAIYFNPYVLFSIPTGADDELVDVFTTLGWAYAHTSSTEADPSVDREAALLTDNTRQS